MTETTKMNPPLEGPSIEDINQAITACGLHMKKIYSDIDRSMINTKAREIWLGRKTKQ